MHKCNKKVGLAAIALMGLMTFAACGGGESALVAPDDGAPAIEAKVLPPGSDAFGKSLAEWMGAYWTWFLGASDEGGFKKVVYLPLPAGELVSEDPWTFVGEIDVTLAPGDKFILPMLVWVGEVYGDDSEDDPDVDSPDEVFEDTTVEVVLDGKTIIDSDDDDMGDFLVFAEFDETIWYDEPTDYGSTGAIWVKGIGFAHTPLKKGEHVLELYVYSEDWNLVFDNTWNITVEK